MLKDSLKKSLLLSLVCFSAPYQAILSADESTSSSTQPCNDLCQSSRVSLRHIENKGIGYKTGYTTLETFIAAPTDLWSVMPFLDVRGHIFNNGQWAANAGVGLRSLINDRIYGGYAYYDYRGTNHRNYNQVSFGVETLGTFWDLRLNGYVVVGNRHSSGYDTQFIQFAGNNVYYSQKFEYSLSGWNGEVGFYPLKMETVTLYTGVGPYYLKGPMATGVWGGQTRAKVMWKDYVGAEVNYSYDHVFKNIVQGQVSFSYPFGPKKKVRDSKGRSCIDNNLLCQRMIEPVAKSEIIPVTTMKKEKLAINPATGQPYTLFFVNNLSHSAGTYESPFSTLAAAESASSPNDVLYVYPGDLTSTGLSSGVTLKNGQQLLGATIDHDLMTTVGLITLPSQASNNQPLLTNASGVVVTLANDNVVSGLYIQNTNGNGILASGVNNVTLTQNYIQGTTLTYSGVELDNVTGIVAASSNTIMNQLSCVHINNTNPISNASYLFTSNTFHVEDGSYGFNIAYTEGSNNYFLSSGNNLYASDTAAVNVTCSNTLANIPHVFTVANCNIGTGDDYAVKITLNNAATAELTVDNSIINSTNGIYTITNNDSLLTANITNNSFNTYEYAFEPETHNTSITNVNFSNNSIACYEYGIYSNSVDASTISATISNNTYTGYEYFIYSDVAGTSTLAGTINHNTANPLFYGIYGQMSDSSHYDVDITNNTINSGYYHVELSNSGSSTYSGNITGNTFVGLDDDDTVYISFNTTGTVSSTIANNVFTGNYGAIDLASGGSGAATINVFNNSIQNSGNSGINVDNSGTNFRTDLSGNTFQGFGVNAVTVSNSGTMCLGLNNNTSNPYPNAYSLTRTAGTLNLVTPTGNVGQIVTTGTITPVSECP